MDLGQILSLYAEFPMLVVASILVLGVIFINGWTDAPNAIATCISTRCIKPKAAILMAAFFNFLGVLTMFFISKQTAQTISDMVDFGTNYAVALDALCAGMVGVIAWGVLAWWFGIPSSESHALIAGITGAGLAAMTMGLDATIEFGPLSSWALTIYGLILSCIFGFFVGFGLTKLIEVCCKKLNRNKARPFFKRAEIASGAAMAYVHGAQDGLKFIGVLFLAIELAAKAKDPTSTIALSNDSSLWWLAIVVALVMGLGTSIGGYKIIKKVGMGMANLEPYQGFVTDTTSAIGILLSTLFGLPVSTTQVKTVSILGVGATRGIKRVKWSIAKEMVLTWLCTFPGCGIIGYVITLIFISIFR